MKLLKAVALVLLAGVSGCKESADNQGGKDYYSLYSGASIPNDAPRGPLSE